MSTTTVSLPSDLASNVASSAGSFLTGQGVANLIILIAGVLLAAVVIEIIIGAIAGRR